MDRFFGTLPDPDAPAVAPDESVLDILRDIRQLLQQSVQTPHTNSILQQHFYIPAGLTVPRLEYTFVFDQPFRFMRLIGSSAPNEFAIWSVFLGSGKQYQVDGGFFDTLTMELPRQFREIVIETTQFAAAPSVGNGFVVALVADEPIREY